MGEKKATVHGLAASTGLSSRTIMRARGSLIGKCTLETLERIGRALGVKVKELFEE